MKENEAQIGPLSRARAGVHVSESTLKALLFEAGQSEVSPTGHASGDEFDDDLLEMQLDQVRTDTVASLLDGAKMWCRGASLIKGKGTMTTHLIVPGGTSLWD